MGRMTIPHNGFMKNHTVTFANSTKFLTLFAPLYWIAVFAAYFLLSRDWGIVRPTSTSQEHLFGLFGFCVFCVIVYTAHTDYKSLTAPSTRSRVMTGIPILVSLFLLAAVVELSQQSWDYQQYETAFRAVAVGDNPYQSTRYLYPPFFAETMVAVYRAGTVLLPVLGVAARESSLWMFVFYIHQSALLFTLLLAYHLSLRFANGIGLKPLKGMLFVSALFLFNVPLLRTIIYNQVNFYILLSILIPLIALNHRPITSGVAIALGGSIKLYPFALVAPLFLTRNWKALIGIFAGVAGITAIQTNLFRDLTLWKQFILFYTSFPVERESAWFRNSSILSFLRNSLDFIGAPANFLTPVFGIIALSVLGWMALRFIQRERLYAPSNQADSTPTAGVDPRKDIGHLVDFSVLSLLIAPSAWEHHYVIAMPLAIWAFAACKRESLWLFAIGLIFIFAMPTFNIFPFSYLRLAGVILLMVLSAPRKTPVS